MASESKRKLNELELEEDEEIKRRNTNNEDIQSKISTFLDKVLTESIGRLVILVQNDQPFVTLQNAVSSANMTLLVMRDDTNVENYELHLNGQKYASGTFSSMQIAKKALSKSALDKLKETCFFIYKKEGLVNVTRDTLQASTSSASTSEAPNGLSVDNGSVAHKIMMNMGWGGNGLGTKEQGDVNAIIVCKCLDRQGFGSNNLLDELTKKLTDFSQAPGELTLIFDKDFTKEERKLIHKVAAKLNLKTKSSGTDNSRKLTVSKKITKMDLVKELLKIGGEDGLYRLELPSKFRHLWQM